MSGLKTGAKGLEPSISGVTGQRDNQLRYAPVMFITVAKNTRACQVPFQEILLIFCRNI